MNNLFTECFSVSASLALAEANPNRAPVWVFVVLGAVIGVVAMVLYFANSVGGGEHDHWYGDPSNNYFGSPAGAWSSRDCGYGPFGGFTQL
jgi:hypothetical protein